MNRSCHANMFRKCCRAIGAVGLALNCLVTGWCLAAEREFSDQDLEFFEKEVRPILVARCYECHSEQTPEPKGGFRIDSRDAILQGGDTGPAIDPSNPQKSLLVDAINYGDLYQMPPKTRLPDTEVAILTKWVSLGVPWPAESPAQTGAAKHFDLETRRATHWCWQPIQSFPPPSVGNPSWARQTLDYFILAKLEEAGLKPASAADKRTLIRRVYFDLIGLPPSPEEVERFVADESSEAFEKVVEQLLESPHFGEKWARHWMDLVRYAETCGHEFDYPIHNAWRYRDYLIRALNQDVPYDQFVLEHIAGDLLPDPRTTADGNESIAATGFWFLHEATHAPVDARGDQAIRVDNQLDVFSKTFLGMTVSCARCHDHKFDAISTKDYYSLAGILHSSRRQQALLDPGGATQKAADEIASLRASGEKLIRESLLNVGGLDAGTVRPWLAAVREVIEGKPSEGEDGITPGHRRSIDRVAQEFNLDSKRLGSWVLALSDPAIGDLANQVSAIEGYESFSDFNRREYTDWIPAGHAFGSQPTQSGQWDLTQKGIQLFPPGIAHSGQQGEKFQGVLRSPTFTIKHRNIFYRLAGRATEVRLIVDGYTMLEFQQLLFGGLKFNLESPDKFTWHRQSGDLGMYLGHRAYIEIIDAGDGWAAIDEIWFSDHEKPPARTSNETPPIQSSQPPIEQFVERFGRRWAEARDRYRTDAATADDAALINWILRHPEVTGFESSELASKLAEIRARIEQLTNAMPQAYRVTAIMDGTGEDLQVYIRGNPRTLGETAPRGNLTALGGLHCGSSTESGRLALARQLVDPTNPLTSRVIVNRLWHHLFGRGIVASVDNFGVLGEKPTHPELLDFLASQFVQDGWSTKRFLKRLVLSSTYQMSSDPETDATTIDPSNQLFHAMPLRRLSGEAIRDATLVISGQLDPILFGPSVPIHLTSFMQGRGRPATSGPLDGNRRRSLYIEIRRNFLSPMMLAFDQPVPFSTVGRRNTSNVPAQALILMNDPFFILQAEHWARRINADGSKTFEQRVDDAYVAAFARPATHTEFDRAREFFDIQAATLGLPVEAARSDARVWADYCHVLFNVKEFSFLR